MFSVGDEVYGYVRKDWVQGGTVAPESRPATPCMIHAAAGGGAIAASVPLLAPGGTVASIADASARDEHGGH